MYGIVQTYTEKTICSISFQIEWDLIVVSVFLSILNQIEFHLVQNRKENCHHDHIPFNLKENRIRVFSVYEIFISHIHICYSRKYFFFIDYALTQTFMISRYIIYRKYIYIIYIYYIRFRFDIMQEIYT